MAESEAMSKSAKRRAAKKARDSAAAEPEPPAPAPAPAKPAPKATASAPAAKAQASAPAAKAKSEPKAKAKSEPKAAAASAPEPKAKAKAKAANSEPAAKAAAAPKEEPAAKAKAEGKKKAKPKKKADGEDDEDDGPVAEAPRKAKEDLVPREHVTQKEWEKMAAAGEWETSSGLSKKAQKQKEAQERKRAEAQAASKAAGVVPAASAKVLNANQKVVGAEFVTPEPKGKAKAGAPVVSQAVTATVLASAKDEPAVKAAEGPSIESFTDTMQVPEAKIGIIIGPKGSTIAKIKEKTECNRIDADGNSFTFSGKKEAVQMAMAAVEELVQKGYTSLNYDDFAENFINVPATSLPDLIGKGGKIIRAIKEELHTEVSIPPTARDPKTEDPNKKVRVTIAGKSENVEKTKGVITDILKYYHSEITHPGEVHEEMDVQEWQRGFIIGKGGSEMRHIQNNFKVRMYIPRDNSMNKNVVIVGEPYGVERAKIYVDKLLNEAKDATSGRDRNEKAEDHFGDEEPIEDWMRPYMYRRH